MADGRVTVTVSETVHVERSPEEVFDFTQDFATRSDWDPAIRAVRVLSDEPRRVQVTLAGIGQTVLEYELFRRADKTSVAFSADSRYVKGGGGSWRYEGRDGGTDWTQVNTLELRRGVIGRLLAPLVRRSLAADTRKAMAKARAMMESLPQGEHPS